MPANKQPPRAIKARVMYRDEDGTLHENALKETRFYPASVPVLCLDLPTATAARKLAAVFNMTEDERLHAAVCTYMAERYKRPNAVTWSGDDRYTECERIISAVLTSLAFPTRKKK